MLVNGFGTSAEKLGRGGLELLHEIEESGMQLRILRVRVRGRGRGRRRCSRDECVWREKV